jgi:hypothetical protein
MSRERVNFSPDEVVTLVDHFNKNMFPTPPDYEQMGLAMGHTSKKIQKWFRNRRYKQKKQDTRAQNGEMLPQDQAPMHGGAASMYLQDQATMYEGAGPQDQAPMYEGPASMYPQDQATIYEGAGQQDQAPMYGGAVPQDQATMYGGAGPLNLHGQATMYGGACQMQTQDPALLPYCHYTSGTINHCSLNKITISSATSPNAALRDLAKSMLGYYTHYGQLVPTNNETDDMPLSKQAYMRKVATRNAQRGQTSITLSKQQ